MQIFNDIWQIAQDYKHMAHDKIDMTILAELSANARVSQTELADRVGLSSTAIARRQRALEDEKATSGAIRPSSTSAGLASARPCWSESR